MMRIYLITGLVALGALYSPSLAEGTTNNCAAVERVLLRSGADVPPLAIGLAALSNGNLAAYGLAQQFPNLPSPLACSYGYWYAKSHGHLGVKS